MPVAALVTDSEPKPVWSATTAGPAVPVIVPALLSVADTVPFGLLGSRRMRMPCAPVTVPPCSTPIFALPKGLTVTMLPGTQ